MRAVVVGGGLSGLFTASELVARGVDDVIVVDEAAEPGGVAMTRKRDGYSLEPAAGSFSLPHPHLGPILDRAGVVVDKAAGETTRFVYHSGRLTVLPASPRALLTPLLPWWAKLRVVGETMVRPGGNDATLDSFSRRRFGNRAGEFLAWVMASGVYAGDPHHLSVTAAFPPLADLERRHGSVIRAGLRRSRKRAKGSSRPGIHFPRDGMAGMASVLARDLGGGFRGEFRVESVRREKGVWVVDGPGRIEADAVVLSVAPWRAADLVGGDLGETLGNIGTAPVVVVGLGGRGRPPFPSGYGALVGPGHDLVTLGILFESSYAPGRAPEDGWLVKVIAGGATRPEVANWDDDRVLATIRHETATILGRDLEVEFSDVIRHHPGIPQYGMGHGSWLASIDRSLSGTAGLHLTGWGYRGVGVTQLATDAARVVADVVS